MSEIIDWWYAFPYHPAVLIVAIIAETLFWLGFSSFVYHWLKGDPLKIERESESLDATNPVYTYETITEDEE